MLPKTHLRASLVLAVILLLLGWTTPMQSFLILFGGFLIDTDHYIWYVYNKKDWSLRRAYRWHYALYLKRSKTVFLHIFHTVESFVLIAILGSYIPPFNYIIAGMLFHMLLDVLHAIHIGHYGKRISMVYELIKNARK